MEDFSFDINSILTDEEAEKLFNEDDQEKQEEEPAKEKEVEPNTEEVDAKPSEKVGEEENNDETGTDAIGQKDDGSSPKFYSSIASALKNDGIFPDFSDEEIDAVNTPEDFAELIEKAVNSKFDDRMKRINEALDNGVKPDDIRQYESTLGYLNSITDEALSAEGDDGDDLRRQLIYNDLLKRGYSEDKAKREVEKSFKSASDIEDAKDALAALKKSFQDGYDKIQKDARDAAERAKQEQKKSAEQFRKMVIEDEVEFGGTQLDKRTKQKVYDAVSKPVWKDPDTGQLLTQVQKFQKEQPLEFLKQLGMWFVMTDGGKNASGLVKKQAQVEKNKSIRELERKINSSALGSDGSLRYMSGNQIEEDNLLSDGWQVDFGQ